MRAAGPDFSGSLIKACLRALHDRAGRIDHIVEQERAFTLHIADDIHHLRLIGALTPFVDNRQIGLKSLGEGASTLHASSIRGNDHQILQLSFA